MDDSIRSRVPAQWDDQLERIRKQLPPAPEGPQTSVKQTAATVAVTDSKGQGMESQPKKKEKKGKRPPEKEAPAPAAGPGGAPAPEGEKGTGAPGKKD